jgi:hypothetical protein
MAKPKAKTGLAVKNVYGLKAKVPKEYAHLRITSVVEIPAGDCPISLRGMLVNKDFPSLPEIIEWYHQVRDYGLENGVFYTAIAIGFWARCDYDSLGYEYEFIHNAIMNYAEIRGEYKDIPVPTFIGVGN